MGTFKQETVMNGAELAKNYAEGKSSSDVFRKAHEQDFLAGYNQALDNYHVTEMLELLKKFYEMSCEYDMRPEDELLEYAYEVNTLIKKVTSTATVSSGF